MPLNYYNLNYYQQLAYIFQNLQIVVAVVGLIGNALNFIVFMRNRFSNFSFSFYSKIMVITDSILLLHSFRHWAAFMFEADIDLVAQFFCTIDEFQPYAAGFASVALLSLISVDRLITIAYPNRFNVIKKRWFQVILVLIVLLYSILMNIELPLYYQLISMNVTDINSSSQTKTIRICVLPPAMMTLNFWIALVNLTLFNVVINNILNIRLVLAVYNSRRRVATKVSNSSNRSQSIRDRKFAINSIGQNLACTILKIPLVIALLVSNYVTMSGDQIQLFFTITITFYTMDNGMAFFINLVTNSIFYNEFLATFGLKRFLGERSVNIAASSLPNSNKT